MDDDNQQRQQDEIEALRAIFEEDFVPETPDPPHVAAFRLTIVPNPVRGSLSAAASRGDARFGNHSAAALVVRFPPQYPRAAAAAVACERIRGLTPAQFSELEAIVAREAAARVGGEAVFELAQIVQDFLAAHNVRPGSLHAQMVAQQQAAAAAAAAASTTSSSSGGEASTNPNASEAVAAAAAAVSAHEESAVAAAERMAHPQHRKKGAAGAEQAAMFDIVQREMERRMLKSSMGGGFLDFADGEEDFGGGFAEHMAAIREKAVQKGRQQQQQEEEQLSLQQQQQQQQQKPATMLPSAIPGYTNLKPLLTKPYGVVFKATSIETGEVVVIKTFFFGSSTAGSLDESSDSSASASRSGDRTKDLERLRKFVRSASELDHDNLLRYIDTTFDRDMVFLIEEYAPRGSLADRINRGKIIGEADIARYTAGVLRGLAFLNEQQLFHGDLKLTKILLSEDDQAMLSDYEILDYLNALTERQSQHISSSFEERMCALSSFI